MLNISRCAYISIYIYLFIYIYIYIFFYSLTKKYVRYMGKMGKENIKKHFKYIYVLYLNNIKLNINK